ncbi:unnamed protein product [Didymodactylos carnosus]|uniref:Phospholipase A2-like central domain-containing protein n=1 Tax=Didymodactylos carnosus TaxID=1234261 RepID=A0A815TVE8_9BILA|nr:unnamed protein product [Didymodactylos carnosus]CAF4373844.1 unnamed protein product [Didymodactylos carnosus]
MNSQIGAAFCGRYITHVKDKISVTTMKLILSIFLWFILANVTVEIQHNSLQFRSMIYYLTERLPTEYDHYGCWCGSQIKGDLYVDKTDLCCKIHQQCYSDVTTASSCSGTLALAAYDVKYSNGTISCKENVDECNYGSCMCDKRAAECFKRHQSTFNVSLFYNISKEECEMKPQPTCCAKAVWNSSGQTVAGGFGDGRGLHQLSHPYNVFVDKDRSVYIADSGNHRIQKWAPGATSGVVVAGGNGFGSAANQLDGPSSVFVDGDGDLYIADNGNYRIQKWKKDSKFGITVAGGNKKGNSTTQIGGSLGIFVDKSGNIYISDYTFQRIVKWAPNATSGTLVAGGNGQGSDANQFNEPEGIHVDVQGNIYVADSTNNRIQKWEPGANTGVTVAGGSKGPNAHQLYVPWDVTLDSYGNIYVSDRGNNRIQKLTPDSTPTAITLFQNLSNPTGLALDFNGNIYVADNGKQRIQMFTLESGALDC